MRYRITFTPPDKAYECVVYREMEEPQVGKQIPVGSRKAHSIWSAGLKIQEELNVGTFKLVRIEETLED